jgi:hypothetical protein
VILKDMAALYNNVWLSGTADDGKLAYRMVRGVRAREYEDNLANETTNRMLAQLDAQVKALVESPEQLARRPENDPIRQWLTLPQSRAATSVFALLPQEQRRLLLDRQHLRFPVAPLNAEQKKQIGDLFHGPEVKPDENGIGPTPIPPEQMDKHEMSFGILGDWKRENGVLRVIMDSPTGLYYTMTTFQSAAKFPLPTHGDPYTGKKVSQTSGLPDPKVVREVSGETWLARLRTLSEKADLPLMADYYRSKPIHVAVEGEEAANAEAPTGALDVFSRPEGYLWWTRGKTLLFRKRDWYHQRLYEVPDRWLLSWTQRLKAQNGVPTYADALSLLELSTSQIVGLSESVGGIADNRLLSGLRELLAVVDACPIDRNKPLYSGPFDLETTPRNAIIPNLADPRHRRLTEAFLQSFNRKVRDLSDPRGIGFLLHHEKGGQEAGSAVRVSIHLYLPEEENFAISAGYLLSLPRSLADTRRDQTQIELVP